MNADKILTKGPIILGLILGVVAVALWARYFLTEYSDIGMAFSWAWGMSALSLGQLYMSWKFGKMIAEAKAKDGAGSLKNEQVVERRDGR